MCFVFFLDLLVSFMMSMRSVHAHGNRVISTDGNGYPWVSLDTWVPESAQDQGFVRGPHEHSFWEGSAPARRKVVVHPNEWLSTKLNSFPNTHFSVVGQNEWFSN